MTERLSRFLLCSLFVLRAASASAQTVNPSIVEFDPSPDHNSALVSRYDLEFYFVGGAQPYQVMNIGKPAPQLDGKIRVDFRSILPSWPIPGMYEARVNAVGPSGSSDSGVSNPFSFPSCSFSIAPASMAIHAPGGTAALSVSTAAGCNWTGISSAGWIGVTTGQTNGSGFLNFSIAPNASTLQRSATISAGGASATITQAGAAPVATTVTVAPATATVPVGGTALLTVTVRDQDNQVMPNAPMTWSAAPSGAVTVTSAGATATATGTASGTAIVTASSGTVSATATVVVNAVVAATVTVGPATSTVAVGGTATLTATVRDLNNQVIPNAGVTWSATPGGAVTLTPSGATARATGTAAGTAIVTARSGSASATAAVVVTAPVATTLTLTPGTATVAVGESTALTATVRDQNNQVIPNAAVAWTAAPSGKLTVTPTGATTTVTGAAVGTVTVTATSGSASGSATVSVTQPVAATVTVTPATATVTVGGTSALTATVRDQNNQVIPNAAVTWTAAPSGRVTVTPTGGTTTATGTAAGTATVTATSGSASGSATVSVTQQSVATTVTVTSGTATLSVGGDVLVMTATVRDQNNQPMPNAAVAWSAAPAGVVTLTPNGTTATVTATSVGTATVTAASGTAAGTATVTVRSPNTDLVYDSFGSESGGSVAGRRPDIDVPNSLWQNFGEASVGLQSGGLKLSSAASTLSGAVINAGVADGTVSADWIAGITSGWGAVVVRFQDPLNFIAARYSSNAVGLYRFAAGQWVLIRSAATVNPTVGSTHRLAVTTSGATITVFWDGVQKIQATDSFLQTRTTHGVMWMPSVDALSMFDNFEVASTATTAVPVLTKLTLTPTSATTSVTSPASFGGSLDRLVMVATAWDQNNRPMPNAVVKWSAKPANVVVLTPSGQTATVAGTRVGQAKVTASIGKLSGTAVVTVTGVAAAAAGVFDSFTGASGPIAGRRPEINAANGHWQVFGPADITLSNGALKLTSAPSVISGATLNTGVANGTVEVDWTPGQTNPWGGIVIRYQDPLNFLVAQFYNGELGLYRCAAGQWTMLGSEPLSVVAGTVYTLAVTASGPTITVFWDGTPKIKVNEAFQETKTAHGVIWAPWIDANSTFSSFRVDGTAGTQRSEVTTVVVTPPTATMAVGVKMQLTATALDQIDQPMPDAPVVWSIAPGYALTLTQSGEAVTVAGVAGGTETITATSGGRTGRAKVTVMSSDTSLVFDSFAGAGLLAGRAPEVNSTKALWRTFGTATASLQDGAVTVTEKASTVSGALLNAGVADATIEADWIVGQADAWGGIVFRYQDPSNFMMARYSQGSVGLFRYAAGQWLAQGTASVSAQPGSTHHLAVTAKGENITISWDGVLLLQAADMFQQTGTVHGLMWAPWVDRISAFDNFRIRQ